MYNSTMSNYAKHPDAEYVMPFLFNIGFFITALTEILKNETNPIKYVYGTLKSEWSGGRPSPMQLNDTAQIEKYIEHLKEINLTPTFTFTNLSLKKESLKDEFCNQLLDIGYKNKCHFITASDILYNHIKSRYPDASMVCSVIIPSINFRNLFFNETKFYNKMLDKYEIVVVRPEWTLKNLDNISKIIKEPSRIEVLVNQSCAYDCPNVARHYKIIGELEHGKITNQQYQKIWTNFCPNQTKPEKQRSLIIDDDKIEKLLAQGVKKIKLQGRTYPLNQMLFELHRHFFRPEITIEDIKKEMREIYQKSLG